METRAKCTTTCQIPNTLFTKVLSERTASLGYFQKGRIWPPCPVRDEIIIPRRTELFVDELTAAPWTTHRIIYSSYWLLIVLLLRTSLSPVVGCGGLRSEPIDWVKAAGSLGDHASFGSLDRMC